MLPLIDQVVYPNSVSPVAVGRPAALAALKAAGDGGLLVAVRQRDPEQEEPALRDLHEVGTIVRLARAARLATGPEEATVVAFLEGLVRARLEGELQREPFLRAIARPLVDTVPETQDPEYVALQASIKDLFEELAQLVEGVPSELPGMLRKVDDAAALSDLVAWSVPCSPVRRSRSCWRRRTYASGCALWCAA
ncbi:MAG: LON peptidase substrate-binding domain-containing protein [Sandaracinaceae bacterium]|nr:LON peptidase substrate-binding domain-containing protein [Sandaracinaceae bacterium]